MNSSMTVVSRSFCDESTGISHHVCGEYGTLEHLDRDSDKEAKARFEWAHVVYFPNILWQTALERVGVL